MPAVSATAAAAAPGGDDLPPRIWAIVQQLLLGVSHTGDDGKRRLDLRTAHMKKSVEGVTSYIVFAYGILMLYGALSNIVLIIHVLQRKLNRDVTHAFVLNNAISDAVKCVVVLPISLYVLLVQNWMLGELLCSSLPMIQDVPIHVTMLTFLFLAWDRCRYLRYPNQPRIPAFICAVGTWLTSICFVLPYPKYITHLDLGEIFKTSEFEGVSICLVNLAGDMKEYVRIIFLAGFAGPLAGICYCFLTGYRELSYRRIQAVVYYETRGARPISSFKGDGDAGGTVDDNEQTSIRDRNPDDGRARYETRETELDVEREKRTQKYLMMMVGSYACCLLPLMIIRLARLALTETYENSSKFDYTYVILVWIAFLPTCTTPALFAFWLQNSDRKLRGSNETIATATDEAPSYQSESLSIPHNNASSIG